MAAAEAVCGGPEGEASGTMASLIRLVNQSLVISEEREGQVRYHMLEDFVLKYSWSAFGYIITSLPVFLPAWGGLGGAQELAISASASDPKERGRGKSWARWNRKG